MLVLAQASWDESFRESGKIYVVVAVLGLILIGIFLYLIVQDRKIRDLEKKIKDTDE